MPLFKWLILLTLLISGCATPRVEQARMAMTDGEYFRAEALLRNEYNRLDPSKDRIRKAKVALDMGECLLNMGMYAKAATALHNARRLGCEDPQLGQMLDFALAEKALADSLLTTRMRVNPAKFINSRRSEYSPAISGLNQDVIYFTSTSEKATGDIRSTVSGMKNGDIFMVRKDARGQWSRPIPLDGSINTPDDEGTPSITADGRTLYFSRASSVPGSAPRVAIFVSQRSEATWGEPEQVVITEDFSVATGHPAISPNGRWLYFASDMPGGFGGLDIWRINVDDPRNPVNLGPRINTPGNESFPYLRNDSSLYFSSDSHPGFGGLDIFKASLNSNGAVTDIKNMGQPINSRADDFSIIFLEGERGFFSSNRLQADGHDNIWEFILPELNISVYGTVTDRDDEPISGAILRLIGNDGSNRTVFSDKDGKYEFPVNPSTRYVMKAGHQGFLNQKQEFTTDTTQEDAAYLSDFRLSAIGRPQVLENIFFDFDKATLRPESLDELNELVWMLEEHPYVTISLEAHTDRKGTDAYNDDLSQRRANAVVEYLCDKGINPMRLSSKGFGKSQPKVVTKRINLLYPQFNVGTLLNEEFISTLNNDDREAADQINRRIEFRITSTEFE